MISKFEFMGFLPNEELREKSNLALERLLDLAPYGSIAVALLEKTDVTYSCAIEIYSKQGPFSVRVTDARAEAVLEAAVRALSRKLDQWKELRRSANKLTEIRYL